MRFQPSAHSLGALGSLGAVDRDTALAARKKFFKAGGYNDYYNIAHDQRGLEGRLSSRNSGVKLAADYYFSFNALFYPAMSRSKNTELTDEFMYPYYTGTQSLKEVLKLVRNKFKSSGGNASTNRMRDSYIEGLTDLIAELDDAAPSSAPSSSSSSGPSLNSKLLSETWNDGSYTYKIDSAGNIKVKNTTFDKKHAKYEAVVSQLNADFSSGKLKKGSLPSRAASTAPAVYTPPAEVVPPPPKGITEQAWFWPTVGGVTVLGLSGLAWWAFKKPKTAAAEGQG